MHHAEQSNQSHCEKIVDQLFTDFMGKRVDRLEQKVRENSVAEIGRGGFCEQAVMDIVCDTLEPKKPKGKR